MGEIVCCQSLSRASLWWRLAPGCGGGAWIAKRCANRAKGLQGTWRRSPWAATGPRSGGGHGRTGKGEFKRGLRSAMVTNEVPGGWASLATSVSGSQGGPPTPISGCGFGGGVPAWGGCRRIRVRPRAPLRTGAAPRSIVRFSTNFHRPLRHGHLRSCVGGLIEFR